MFSYVEFKEIHRLKQRANEVALTLYIERGTAVDGMEMYKAYQYVYRLLGLSKRTKDINMSAGYEGLRTMAGTYPEEFRRDLEFWTDVTNAYQAVVSSIRGAKVPLLADKEKLMEFIRNPSTLTD